MATPALDTTLTLPAMIFEPEIEAALVVASGGFDWFRSTAEVGRRRWMGGRQAPSWVGGSLVSEDCVLLVTIGEAADDLEKGSKSDAGGPEKAAGLAWKQNV